MFPTFSGPPTSPFLLPEAAAQLLERVRPEEGHIAYALFWAWLCFTLVLHLEAFQCPCLESGLLLFGACPLTCGLCYRPTKLHRELPTPPRCQSRASGRSWGGGQGAGGG